MAVGGRGEKARAQQPLLRASQPALSPKVAKQSLLDGAEGKTQTVSHPTAPTIDKDQSDEGRDSCCYAFQKMQTELEDCCNLKEPLHI